MNTSTPISVIMVDNRTGKPIVNFCIGTDPKGGKGDDLLVKDLIRPTRNLKALAYLRHPDVTFVRGLEDTPFATVTLPLNESSEFLALFDMQNLKNFNNVKMKELADMYRSVENLPIK